MGERSFGLKQPQPLWDLGLLLERKLITGIPPRRRRRCWPARGLQPAGDIYPWGHRRAANHCVQLLRLLRLLRLLLPVLLVVLMRLLIVMMLVRMLVKMLLNVQGGRRLMLR